LKDDPFSLFVRIVHLMGVNGIEVYALVYYVNENMYI